MKLNSWLFQKSFEFVKNRRNCIFPNMGFQSKLIQYEIALELRKPDYDYKKRQDKRKKSI
jgi:hypothetical protein